MNVTTIVVLGMTCEALVEYGKLIFNRTINWKQLVALLLGVLIAVLMNVDLYAAVGIDFIVPYVGVVLTGILASRGSNYLADVIKWFQSITLKKQDAIFKADGDPEADEDTEDGGDK